jgi:drug/metabolite transporter (DMT)-like permease
VPVLAVAVVLTSAMLHAGWNLLLANAPKGLDATAVAMGLGLVVWTPIALVRWRLDAGVWPYVAASAALELAYFAALTLAYSRAPAHAVYPVARGLAPVLLLPVAALAAATGLSWATWLGVLAIALGVVCTAVGEVNRRAVLTALPVAATIAGYTYVDSVGLHHAEPATYLWLIMAPVFVALLGARLLRHRSARPLVAQLRPATAGLGIGLFAAYGLTLVALSLVPATLVPAVAALRESSILFLLAFTWLSTVDAQEKRPTRATVAGAVLVFTGVATLALA